MNYDSHIFMELKNNLCRLYRTYNIKMIVKLRSVILNIYLKSILIKLVPTLLRFRFLNVWRIISFTIFVFLILYFNIRMRIFIFMVDRSIDWFNYHNSGMYSVYRNLSSWATGLVYLIRYTLLLL